jgi:hypothetical protein
MLVALLAGGIVSPAIAEDVEKKWRIGGTLGIFNPQDNIESDAGNVLTLVDEDLQPEEFFIDPRNDSAVFGKLDLNPSFGSTFYAQYAVTKTFIVEASIGYTKQDLGDVELQAQFDREPIPDFQPFLFHVSRIPVGEVERIPLQFTGIARFRPRSSFNPYVGFGVGYSFHGFKVAPEFNQLSMNMDGSFGGLTRVSEATFGTPVFTLPNNSQVVDLKGASVDIQDSFEWHFASGAEYSFKRKWAVIFDVRWSFSNERVSVQFNEEAELGVAVPQRRDFVDSEWFTNQYGGVYIANGGLVDGGVLTELDGSPCGANINQCIFDSTQRDGVTDPGIYYVKGGDFEYGGISLQLGVRYTF